MKIFLVENEKKYFTLTILYQSLGKITRIGKIVEECLTGKK
tara:strand:- start:85 stop:207 length:123 start_codon:yes stop_codon:yes gene_type:complete